MPHPRPEIGSTSMSDRMLPPLLPNPRFERRIRIRFSDCDPAGIVFYPQYFVQFNGLVEDWVTDGLGISYADLIGQRRVGLPTVRVESTFKAVSRMGDDVCLGLQVAHLGGRSIRLRMDCRGDQDEPSTPRVEVHSVLVTTDLSTHSAIEVPPDLRAAIERFSQPIDRA